MLRSVSLHLRCGSISPRFRASFAQLHSCVSANLTSVLPRILAPLALLPPALCLTGCWLTLTHQAGSSALHSHSAPVRSLKRNTIPSNSQYQAVTKAFASGDKAGALRGISGGRGQQKPHQGNEVKRIWEIHPLTRFKRLEGN